MDSFSEVTVLFSGGIDSTALIALYLSRDIAVNGIHFDYGQPSFLGEKRAVQYVSAYYQISVETVRLGLAIGDVKGEYHCRNALLLMSAAGILSSNSARFAVGIHSGTPYYDCSSAFLKDVQKVFDGYFNGCVQVEAPFLELSKKDIIEICKIHDVPIGLTYSCERHSESPCGKCLSCIDRELLAYESL